MDQEKTAESIEYACTQTINNKSKNNNAKVPVIQNLPAKKSLLLPFYTEGLLLPQSKPTSLAEDKQKPTKPG